MTTKQLVSVFNTASQNITQQDYTSGTLGNLPLQDPTVAQLNAAISAGQTSQPQSAEPAFGEHAREAADALKRVFRR